MKSHYALIAVLSLLIAGCGTINTVVREDAIASRNLKEINSNCESIPRVYSGASYDFCTLYGPPALGYGGNGSSLVGQVISDFVVSGLLDTLVLPYTIYRQSSDGNINIK
jgi:uncharacterized protein YceK